MYPDCTWSIDHLGQSTTRKLATKNKYTDHPKTLSDQVNLVGSLPILHLVGYQQQGVQL